MMHSHPIHVTLCLAASLDGKINRSTTPHPTFTSRHDRDKLFRLRAQADAVLVGAETVRRESLPPLVRQKAYQLDRIKAGLPPNPAVVVVSSSLDLPWNSPFFSNQDQKPYLLTDSPPDDHAREPIERHGIRVITAGHPIDFARGLALLQEHGFSRFLAEGGGTLSHCLFQAHLISRLHLTLAPYLFAGQNTPALVNGSEFQPPVEFRLASCEQVGSELHLIYER